MKPKHLLSGASALTVFLTGSLPTSIHAARAIGGSTASSDWSDPVSNALRRYARVRVTAP